MCLFPQQIISLSSGNKWVSGDIHTVPDFADGDASPVRLHLQDGLDDPPEYWTENPPAFASPGTVRELASSQAMEYQVKFGLLGRLLDKLVMRRKLDKTLAEVFVNLKRFFEKGG